MCEGEVAGKRCRSWVNFLEETIIGYIWRCELKNKTKILFCSLNFRPSRKIKGQIFNIYYTETKNTMAPCTSSSPSSWRPVRACGHSFKLYADLYIRIYSIHYTNQILRVISFHSHHLSIITLNSTWNYLIDPLHLLYTEIVFLQIVEW